MPTISVNQDLITKLLTVHGFKHDVEELSDQLPLLGTDIDRCDEDTLDIEIFLIDRICCLEKLYRERLEVLFTIKIRT